MTMPKAELMRDIDLLDFGLLKQKLQDPEEGKGWTAEYCDRVEREYKRYLFLNQAFFTQSIVPSREVDAFWHAHILDTRAYMDDCERVFGEYLHHFPYFGMQGDGDVLVNAYADTLDRYRGLWGEPPEDLWPNRGEARCPNCARRCR